jgi:hypothetical protein
MDLDTRRQIVKLGLLGLIEAEVVGREVPLEPVDFGCAGIGTIHGCWASSQTRAICPGVTPLAAAMVLTSSARAADVRRVETEQIQIEEST